MVFLFQCRISIVSRFPFPRCQSPQCWHGRKEYWKLPAFFPNIPNFVTNSSCWQCFVRFYFATLSAVIVVHVVEIFHCRPTRLPTALLTRLAKQFHTKLLHKLSFSQNCPRKHFCFDAAVFHLSIKDYCKKSPHRSCCFLSMFKLHCKRHYRNLAGVQHDVNTSRKRRRRGVQLYKTVHLLLPIIKNRSKSNYACSSDGQIQIMIWFKSWLNHT